MDRSPSPRICVTTPFGRGTWAETQRFITVHRLLGALLPSA